MIRRELSRLRFWKPHDRTSWDTSAPTTTRRVLSEEADRHAAEGEGDDWLDEPGPPAERFRQVP